MKEEHKGMIILLILALLLAMWSCIVNNVLGAGIEACVENGYSENYCKDISY